MSNDINFFIDKKAWFKNKLYVNKEKLINELPKNLLTKSKLKFLDTLGNNISEQEFVQLLKYQTLGADYININYLLNYYNTCVDANQMPIFTKYFTYRCLKPQALYTYVILNSFKTHPVFKHYNDKLIQFLEKKLEIGVFPSDQNFKYDMKIRDVAIEIDESHHNKPKKMRKQKNKQQIIDDEKDALVKLHGKTLFRISCDEVVNIADIKNEVFNDFQNNKNHIYFRLLRKAIKSMKISTLDSL